MDSSATQYNSKRWSLMLFRNYSRIFYWSDYVWWQLASEPPQLSSCSCYVSLQVSWRAGLCLLNTPEPRTKECSQEPWHERGKEKAPHVPHGHLKLLPENDMLPFIFNIGQSKSQNKIPKGSNIKSHHVPRKRTRYI